MGAEKFENRQQLRTQRARLDALATQAAALQRRVDDLCGQAFRPGGPEACPDCAAEFGDLHAAACPWGGTRGAVDIEAET